MNGLDFLQQIEDEMKRKEEEAEIAKYKGPIIKESYLQRSSLGIETDNGQSDVVNDFLKSQGVDPRSEEEIQQEKIESEARYIEIKEAEEILSEDKITDIKVDIKKTSENYPDNPLNREVNIDNHSSDIEIDKVTDVRSVEVENNNYVESDMGREIRLDDLLGDISVDDINTFEVNNTNVTPSIVYNEGTSNRDIPIITPDPTVDKDPISELPNEDKQDSSILYIEQSEDREILLDELNETVIDQPIADIDDISNEREIDKQYINNLSNREDRDIKLTDHKNTNVIVPPIGNILEDLSEPESDEIPTLDTGDDDVTGLDEYIDLLKSFEKKVNAEEDVKNSEKELKEPIKEISPEPDNLTWEEETVNTEDTKTISDEVVENFLKDVDEDGNLISEKECTGEEDLTDTNIEELEDIEDDIVDTEFALDFDLKEIEESVRQKVLIRQKFSEFSTNYTIGFIFDFILEEDVKLSLKSNYIVEENTEEGTTIIYRSKPDKRFNNKRPLLNDFKRDLKNKVRELSRSGEEQLVRYRDNNGVPFVTILEVKELIGTAPIRIHVEPNSKFVSIDLKL